MTALPMTKPLPPVFAVDGVGDRWFLLAPSHIGRMIGRLTAENCVLK